MVRVLCRTRRHPSSSSTESQSLSAAEDESLVPRVHLNYSGIVVIAISTETGGQRRVNPGLVVRSISRHIVETPLGFNSRHSRDSFPFPWSNRGRIFSARSSLGCLHDSYSLFLIGSCHRGTEISGSFRTVMIMIVENLDRRIWSGLASALRYFLSYSTS